MPVTVIAFGKMKEKYYEAACKEYLKRLQRFGKISLIELPDLVPPKNPSPKEIDNLLEKEGETLLKYVKDGDYLIALAIEGKQLSSEEHAAKMQRLLDHGENIVYAIGSSEGLGKSVLQRANEQISFSPMTFPHQLVRVMLLEQIYRSFKINANERYHK